MRRRRDGTGAIVRAIEATGARIIEAIREQGAEHKASREATAATILEQGYAFLRAALDDATPRTVVLDPPAANDAGEPPYAPGPTTPPGRPANDRDPPSGRR
jgi:hypothetical protein